MNKRDLSERDMFIDPESKYPVLVTTSRLLSTGVDVQTCRLIVLDRAGHDVAHFAVRIPQLPSWVQRERQPTLRQLEKLAKTTRTPLGYLFLPEPPDERLPVPDYRTVWGASRARPSPDLLDTLYTMQRRQEWLRESLIESENASTHEIHERR